MNVAGKWIGLIKTIWHKVTHTQKDKMHIISSVDDDTISSDVSIQPRITIEMNELKMVHRQRGSNKEETIRIQVI